MHKRMKTSRISRKTQILNVHKWHQTFWPKMRKNWKPFHSEDIHRDIGMESGIEKYAMPIIKSENDKNRTFR